MPLCLISSIYKLHCFDFIFILQVKCVPKKKKSRDHLQNKNMLSKFLYRRSASIFLKNEKNTMNFCTCILHCLIDLYMEIRFTVNVCRSTLWCWTSLHVLCVIRILTCTIIHQDQSTILYVRLDLFYYYLLPYHIIISLCFCFYAVCKKPSTPVNLYQLHS